jgi:hypothetical protein
MKEGWWFREETPKCSYCRSGGCYHNRRSDPVGVADCHKVNSKSLMPLGMGLFYFANSLIPAGIGPVKQPTCRESYQGGLF